MKRPITDREASIARAIGVDLPAGIVAHETAYGSVLVALPREQWAPFADADPETGLGPCACRWCSPRPRQSRPSGARDCVGISETERKAWRCHGPEYHGKRPKRGAAT